MDLNPDFQAAVPDPSAVETGLAAFKRSTAVSILYQPLMVERLMPTDTTPATDADIEQRLVEERLVTADQLAAGDGGKVLKSFTDIATKGQLEAQINKFKLARDNDAILQASSTPAWAASQFLAGVLDPATFIPGTLGAKTVGKPLLESLAKFGAGAAVQAAVTEGERAIFDPTAEHDAKSLMLNIGGATILGGFIGHGISKLLPHGEQVRLGNGLKSELISAVDGTLEKNTAALGDTISEKTRQYANGELKNETLASAIEAKTGEKATPSQLAIADSLGMEAMARVGSKFMGKSIPLEMMHADSVVAREFAGDAFMIRGALEKDGQQIFAPDSLYSKAGVVDGHLGQARKGVIDNWKDWAAEQAVVSGVVERNLSAAWKKTLRLGGDETHLAEFSDLVAHAVAFKSSMGELHPDLRARVEHPAVQKAAAAYRTFDDTSFDMLKRSGLITADRAEQDHLRHVYNSTQIGADQGRHIATEAYYAGKHHFAQASEASAKVLAAAEAKAHNTFINDSEAIGKLLQQAHIDEKIPGGTRKGAVGQFQKRLRETLNDFYERYTNDYADAVKANAAQIDKAERRLEKVSMNKPAGWFDQQLANMQADMSAKLDADSLSIRQKHYRAMISKFDTAEQNVVKKVQDKLDLSLEEARANHAYNLSPEAYGKSAEWGRNHAEGNFKAVVYGVTGDGSGGVGLTGGNVRGTRMARNYFTPTKVLLRNGWLDTDVMKIMDKTARQDMKDAVLGSKYRRPMTAEEAAMQAADSPEAYWKHGDDPTTVPDLDLREVRRKLVDEYLAKGVAASDLGQPHGPIADPKRQRYVDPADFSKIENGQVELGRAQTTAATRGDIEKLTEEARRMMSYIDHTRDTFRGTHTYGHMGETAQLGIDAAKTLAFTSYLGTSVLTNTMDATRLAVYHGIGTTMQYMGARLAEKFNDGALFKDVGRAELREQAAALGFGLEQYHNVRAQGLAGVTDPFANSAGSFGSTASSVIDTASGFGSKVFLLEWWNNYVKSAAYGLSQYRLSKLALTDAAQHTAGDAEWLKYIGMDPQRMASVRKALNDQGVTEIKGSELGRIKLNDWADLRAKEAFLSSMNKDVTTAVVHPNQGNAAMGLQHPIISVILQFQSFAQEAAGSINMRAGQQLAQGQYGVFGQTVLALSAGALMNYYLKGVANGDLDKRTEAFEKTPGQVMYQLIDYAGFLPLVTNVNNFFENVTSVGLKRGAANLFGDRGQMLQSSGRSDYRPDASALAGPFGRVVGDYSSAANSALTGKFDEKAQNRVSRSVPFNNALPFKVGARVVESMTGQGLDAFRASRGTREAIENSGITPLPYLLPFAQNRRN